MSNLEHLIENTIIAVKEDKTQREFESSWDAQVNYENISATLDEIWEIAEYVVYTHCGNCERRADNAN